VRGDEALNVRAFVLLLVLANLVLYAWQRGWLGESIPAGREPQRLARQIDPQAIRLLTEEEARRLREQARAAAKQELVCLELGDFDADAAARVRPRLDALDLGDRLSALAVDPSVWYLVYLPPLTSPAIARRTIEELQRGGVQDVAVIQDQSSLQNGISLGRFRDPVLAQKRQAEIRQRGFDKVQIATRPGSGLTRFRIQAADAALAQRLADLQTEFGATRLAACAP
jgi:hypothetical protein